MSFPRTLLCLLVAAACGAALFAAAPAVSQAVFAPAKIAFVDVPEVLKKYAKSNDVRTWVNREAQVIEREYRDRKDALRKKEAELEILVVGTPKYAAKKRELDRENWEIEYDSKEKLRLVRATAVQKMSLVYTEIRREAENYARRNGLSAVFMVAEQDIPARSPDELQALIATRPVLYHDKGLDITDTILGILEKK